MLYARIVRTELALVQIWDAPPAVRSEEAWEIVMPAIEVIYEKGVFRPLQPVELPEGAVGEVLLAPTPDNSTEGSNLPMKADTDQANGVDTPNNDSDGQMPGQVAYRLLMEIAALPHMPPDEQTDIGEQHDDILYPKRGRMP